MRQLHLPNQSSDLILNFFKFAAYFLRITTKDGRLVPLRLYPYQKKIIDEILKALESGRPVRVIILKGRQMGISTVIAGFFFWLVMTNFNRRLVLIADISSRTDAVFGIYKRFLDLLDVNLRPMVSTNNDREIHFQNPEKELRISKPGLDSAIKAETAQDPNAGRSGTAQFAHKTEAAYYPYPGEIDTGLGNSIPLASGTIIIEESTANGMAGSGAHFYTRWQQAVSGQNGYIPIFIGWYESPDYEIPTPKDFVLTDAEAMLSESMSDFSDYWKALPEKTKLAKLNWRRAKLADYRADVENIYSPEEKFNQEFPWCPDVAFISSGNPVFDVEKIKHQIACYTKQPVKQIDITPFVQGTFLENYLRGLKVFKVPEKGMKYCIASDVSEGLEGGDASHVKVIDQKMREVACWHGLIDADLLGELMVGLGIFYNNALMTPELNNMGAATMARIKAMNYSNIYNREHRDELTDKATLKLGWKTTAANKNPMIANLKAMHRDDIALIRDIDTLREMLKLERDEKGYIELNGRDRVAALCIALEVWKQLPQEPVKQEPEPKKDFYSLTPEERRKRYEKRKDGYYS